MRTPLAELLTRVDELNSPDSPFVFRAVGDRIQGAWDVAHVQYAALLGAGQIDDAYAIEVTLDEDEGTFDTDETQTTSKTSGGLSTDGSFHFGGSTSTFTGKQSRMTRSFVVGTRVTTPEGDGTSAGWSFDTDRIKQPLFDFLAANGWEKKKGFFGRLFGG
ncbi:hypothetical protein [Microbacterium sp. CIAB417]|uniref:hypothetical protein n=1 Tax=Microbacterium sp. CIAB417 TaxID=2860287 RepID=UPI001FAC63A3|nr:hypothetical protein [Microbacterium sp. CIAB417]